MPTTPCSKARGGFSLVEVVVAMVILTIGILAMVGSTGIVFLQLKDSGRATERALALQQVIEQMRSQPFDSVRTQAETATTIGDFRLWWRVTPVSTALKNVEIISEGPGIDSKMKWSATVRDTFGINIVRP